MSAKSAPSPPPTPGQLVAARYPRSTWPFKVLGGSLVLLAASILTSDVQAATTSQQDVLHMLHAWAPIVAASGVVVAAAVLAYRLQTIPRGAATTRILAAAAHALKLGPNQVELRSARWRTGWRKHELMSGEIVYASGHVSTDLSPDLVDGLAPFSAGPLTVTWEPHRDCFHTRLTPPRPLRLEEQHSMIAALTDTLEHVLGPIVVDQRDTTLNDKTGAIERFVASYPRTTRDMAESFRQRLKVILDAKVPCPTGYWGIHLDPAKSNITVLPSQPMPRHADLPIGNLDATDRLRLPLGVAAGDEPVYWEPTVFPHMLLVGPTGSGKTILINSLVNLTAARGWWIDLIDPKELSYRGYMPDVLRDRKQPIWPGIHTVATTEAEMEASILRTYQELLERYYQLKIFGVVEDELQPRLLVVDEAGEMVERLNAWYTSEDRYQALVDQAVSEGRNPKDVAKPRGTKHPVLGKLWSLLRLGRQARIFVVTGTQRPDVNFIPGEARTNLTCKVAMGKQDGYALDMIFSTRCVQQRVHETVIDPMTGERILQRIRGRATVDVGAGPQSIQTYWTPDPATVILGTDEATARLVRRHHQYVIENADRYLTQARRKDVAQIGGPKSSECTEEAKTLIDQRLARDLLLPQTAPPARRESGKPACTLTVGDIATLEIDGQMLEVSIIEIEEDPGFLGDQDETEELQITYQVADGNVDAGQLGVTTLGKYEVIPA